MLLWNQTTKIKTPEVWQIPFIYGRITKQNFRIDSKTIVYFLCESTALLSGNITGANQFQLFIHLPSNERIQRFFNLRRYVTLLPADTKFIHKCTLITWPQLSHRVCSAGSNPQLSNKCTHFKTATLWPRTCSFFSTLIRCYQGCGKKIFQGVWNLWVWGGF